ncbi:auxin-like 1 protein [Zea mays]|uniref:Auxin-like 1 protein n=1 Tax=Zea mays TaxID=4577 RepID=A0A1D6NHV4_MAIZE|nr:auxin-like 1 protein [Zea mays]
MLRNIDWLNFLILKSRDGQMEKKEICEHCCPHCNIYLVQTVAGRQFPSQTLSQLLVSRRHTGRQPFVSIQIKCSKEVLQSDRNTFVRRCLIFLRRLGISTILKSASGIGGSLSIVYGGQDIG